MRIKIKKYITLSAFVLLMLVVPTHFVFAQDSDGSNIAQFLSWVMLWIASTIGWLLTKLMTVLNTLFEKQDFINSGVDMGWAAARDVSNMFFILILLVISFATILRLENYSMKRYLPKLLLMAVLINYSKTITLLAIDFSQIVMLTFSSSFSGTESSFVQMLQLDKLTDINKTFSIDLDDWGILQGIILYTLFILITFFIIIMLIGILIMRMVMFWILIVLSPLAFMAYAMPGGSSYFSRWSGELTKYLVVGPVLAFFTWLSMVTMQSATKDLKGIDLQNAKTSLMAMGQPDNIFNFIVAIGMLVGTIKITQSIGAMGGGFGANMASNFKNRGMSFAKGATIGAAGTAMLWGRKRANEGGVVASKYLGRRALDVAGAGLQGVGSYTGNSSISSLGKMTSGWGKDLEKSRNDAKYKKRLDTLKKFGVGEEGLKGIKSVADSKLGRSFKTGAGIAGTIGAAALGGPIAAAVVGGFTSFHAAKKGFGRKAGEDKADRETRKDVVNKMKDDNITIAKQTMLSDPGVVAQKNLRDNKIKQAENDRDIELRDLSEKRKKGTIDGKKYNEERKAITDDFEHKKNSAEKTHNEAPEVISASKALESTIKSINDDHTKKIESINNEKKSFSEKYFADYHPNKVTIEAANLGLKENEVAEKRITAMKSGYFHEDMDKSAFYSASGFTSLQKKTFDELVSGSDASLTALRQIKYTLEKINKQEIKPSFAQLQVVQHMKQGAAAWGKKGGDLSKLSDIIPLLDDIKTGDGSDEKHSTTVAGFEEKVIT